MKSVRIGLIGSKFISAIHFESFKGLPGAEVVAVAARRRESAESFARPRGIPRATSDYREILAMPDVDVIVLGCPNDLHAEITVAAAAAGKHVVCEKPLCLTLDEADRMIEACKAAGVLLLYAEELCFAPKYVRLKQLVDQGAVGKVYQVKQAEKHDGPHADWFWDVTRSGGGVTLDMGCHGIEFARWILSGPSHVRPRVTSVYADMKTAVHGKRTAGDDSALIILEFDNGATALIEESWAKPGGMDDRAEIYGDNGLAYADLLRGNSILTYSATGYDYAVEKAGSSVGWSHTIYEEGWNYGFPQEMAHFLECVRGDATPLVTGEDGRAVLEIILAAYASAGQGRKVPLPFDPGHEVKLPIQLWKPEIKPRM